MHRKCIPSLSHHIWGKAIGSGSGLAVGSPQALHTRGCAPSDFPCYCRNFEYFNTGSVQPMQSKFLRRESLTVCTGYMWPTVHYSLTWTTAELQCVVGTDICIEQYLYMTYQTASSLGPEATQISIVMMSVWYWHLVPMTHRTRVMCRGRGSLASHHCSYHWPLLSKCKATFCLKWLVGYAKPPLPAVWLRLLIDTVNSPEARRQTCLHNETEGWESYSTASVHRAGGDLWGWQPDNHRPVESQSLILDLRGMLCE